MEKHSTLWRTVIAMLLCASVVMAVPGSAAFAQGKSAQSGNPFQQAEILALQQEIANLKQQIAVLTQNAQNAAALQAQITTLQQQVAALALSGESVVTLQAQVAALTAQLATVTQLEQQVTTLQGQLATVNTQLTSLATLQQQVSALEGQLASINTQLATSATLSQQVTSLQSQVSSLTAQLADLSAKLATAGGGGFAVYDRTGKKVGDVVGVADNIPWVGMSHNGRSYALQVLPGQMLGGFLWFDGPACTGNPFISDISIDLGFTASAYSIAAVQEPGGVVYVNVVNAAPKVTGVRAFMNRDGTCSDFGILLRRTVIAAEPLVSLDASFARPYSVH